MHYCLQPIHCITNLAFYFYNKYTNTKLFQWKCRRLDFITPACTKPIDTVWIKMVENNVNEKKIQNFEMINSDR